MKHGERTPPSSVVPLRPFMPPFQRELFGPLSEKNTTIVLEATPSASRRPSQRPTLSSMFSTIASTARVTLSVSRSPSGPRCSIGRFRQRSQYARGTMNGEWGVLIAR